MSDDGIRSKAQQTIEVEVTARDIRSGLPYDPRMCPVAKAVRRATRRRYVRVEGYIEIGDPEQVGSVQVPLPITVNRFLTQFDNGERVFPFKFSLDATALKGK